MAALPAPHAVDYHSSCTYMEACPDPQQQHGGPTGHLVGFGGYGGCGSVQALWRVPVETLRGSGAGLCVDGSAESEQRP